MLVAFTIRFSRGRCADVHNGVIVVASDWRSSGPLELKDLSCRTWLLESTQGESNKIGIVRPLDKLLQQD